MSKKEKNFINLVSRTKIYLAIIAILLIILCVKDTRYVVPSIIIYALIVMYSLWTNNKRIDEISKHIQDVTLNVDSTIKSSLVNSPFPLIIMETDGNIIWKSSKFVSEFGNIDINNITKSLAKEIKLDILESKLNKENVKNKSIYKEIEIGKNTYKIFGEYVKSKKKKQNEYMMTLYFIDNTEYRKTLNKLEDEKLQEISGGTTLTDLTLTATLLNAIVKVGELVFEIGSSFGSSVRRMKEGNICGTE